MDFQLTSQYNPTGDQPQAIEQLVAGIKAGEKAQTLLGVTGSGKTFTMANVIEQVGKPTLILSHNKTLAAQLYSEFKGFFPNNSVQYFVSYYDYYQPEAYIPTVDKYIEKDLMINDEIEKLRLSTVSALLSGRKDVVVVSSVSCLYGMGNPEDFDSNVVTVKVGQKITRNKFLRSLVNSLYSRNELELSRGTFRVKGDTVDIRLAYEEIIVRVTFWGDEIESIKTLHPSDNVSLGSHDIFQIYPANLFVTSPERMGSAIGQIELDLGEQYNYFMREAKELEAKRLLERVTYDVEMLREVGHCSGIENYSRYFDGRQPGMRPFCLLDYFPKDFLTIVDESHVTLPQCRAMYGGDLSRKMNLVEYGFRLPAALDNRPLKFEEFERLTPQVLYVSATPADYELEKCEGVVVEQIIRPTGLLDPVIEVRPSLNQIDDLLHEINLRIERNERVLVTTLTKRMAEELNDYLTKIRIKTAYIHSDVDTLDRIKILDGLRSGEFDVLVGVNLLREGLDLPEVSLVAILDADKEGFLRSHRSLTQTVGRAARNLNGTVIMYADKITDSMQQTIDETSRRRAMQLAYNEEHGITPQAIIKARNSIIGLETDADDIADNSRASRSNRPDRGGKTGRAKSIPYAEEYSTKVDLAADPVIPYLSADALQKLITTKRLEMVEAAKRMDFIDAARLRDEVLAMEDRLSKMEPQTQKEESKMTEKKAKQDISLRSRTIYPGADRYLPTSVKEMKALGWNHVDVVLFSGDAYVDHPSFGAAVIGRTLQAAGYNVAIVPQPNWQDDLRDFRKFGAPRLFFGVSAGAMDSMVNHYTAARRRRSDDAYTPGGRHGARPDHPTIVYSAILRDLFPDTPIIAGGIEASMRRLSHYDYWEDRLRPSLLADCKADLISYGMGEQSVVEIAHRLEDGEPVGSLRDLPQTAVRIPDADFRAGDDDIILHSFADCLRDKRLQAENFRHIEQQSNSMNGRILWQHHDGGFWVKINPMYPPMTTGEIDASFDLPYTRLPHPRYKDKRIPAYEMIRHSVNIHRGCFGGCSFCTISAHQGKFIASRSRESVLREVRQVTQMPDFKGYISDIGGPSANMYGLGGKDLSICAKCLRPSCLHPKVCTNLNTDHQPLLDLYRAVDSVAGVKKSFIGSGVRYDLSMHHTGDRRIDEANRTYNEELITRHVSGRLKVAPEHTSDTVLNLMRKLSFQLYHEFSRFFDRVNSRHGLKQQLIPYFISSHPGCREVDMAELAAETKELNLHLEQIQDFTPTPMTLSTEIYYTGYHPYTGERVFTATTPEQKQAQRKYFFWYDRASQPDLIRSLQRLHRPDLLQRLFPRQASYTYRNKGKK